MNYPFRAGGRVYFRALEPDDLEHCLRWFNDPLITRFLDQGAFPISRSQEKEKLEELTRDEKSVVFAVCRDDNDFHIGNIGFHRISHINRNAEIGLVIGERSIHRKGYGTAALNLMVKYGFESLNFQRIYMRVLASNDIAIDCYKKLGFVEEGVMRGHAYKDGQYHDEIFMGLLRSEWEAQ
jgi:RimJ/RimL family protein N-acetyltransferase